MVNLTYFNKFLTRVKFQIWGHKAVTKENKEIWDLYAQEQFHAKLMAETLALLDRLPPYSPKYKLQPYEKDWCVGVINPDWYSVKPKPKTEEKDKSMSDNS
jgi:hypothetical protein